MMEPSNSLDLLVVKKLGQQVKVARDELNNIRTKLNSLSKQHSLDACRLESLLISSKIDTPKLKFEKESSTGEPDSLKYHEFQPIGYIKTCFKTKNGTPRQPNICPTSKGHLELDKKLFSNAEHCLEGLKEFSHAWIIFVFHKNANLDKQEVFTKAKVSPPRLDGQKVGVFASRSPYRPCPIGLSLSRIDEIEGGTIFFTGLDLVDGTPVLDIKPYIEAYDMPRKSSLYGEGMYGESLSGVLIPRPHTSETPSKSLKMDKMTETKDLGDTSTKPNQIAASSDLKSDCGLSMAAWLSKPELDTLSVGFTLRAQKDLVQFHPNGYHAGKCALCFESIKSVSEAKKVITEILTEDPRSVYRRKKCSNQLYYFSVDSTHITCWFDDSSKPNIAEVLRIQPNSA